VPITRYERRDIARFEREECLIFRTLAQTGAQVDADEDYGSDLEGIEDAYDSEEDYSFETEADEDHQYYMG
jgi:hypothetical protein